MKNFLKILSLICSILAGLSDILRNYERIKSRNTAKRVKRRSRKRSMKK